MIRQHTNSSSSSGEVFSLDEPSYFCQQPKKWRFLTDAIRLQSYNCALYQKMDKEEINSFVAETFPNMSNGKGRTDLGASDEKI